MTDDGRVHLAIGEFLDALRDLGVPLATTRTGRSYCQPDACGSHRPSQRFGTRPPRRGQPRDNGRGAKRVHCERRLRSVGRHPLAQVRSRPARTVANSHHLAGHEQNWVTLAIGQHDPNGRGPKTKRNRFVRADHADGGVGVRAVGVGG